MISSVSSTSASVTSGIYTSINQNAGASCLAPMPMVEIREISSFCNSCVMPDKYWSHHHHSASSVIPSNPGRHSTVYPQVFYSHPPQNYPTANVSMSSPAPQPLPEWSCPPSHSSHAHNEPYSHFMYHHQYPSQQDYNFFMTPGSSYEPEVAMASGTSAQVSASQSTSSASGNIYDSAVTSQLTFASVQGTSKCVSDSITQPYPSHCASKSSLPVPEEEVGELSLTSSSEDSVDEDEDDRSKSDKYNKEVISIDDESRSEDTFETSCDSNLKCVICQKQIESSSILPQNAASPQLSKILENIDDDELDISVCSGDIEIGGIEDEMIQQAEEQQQYNAIKITLSRLSQLVGIPVSNLTEIDTFEEKHFEMSPEYAVLCLKCKKLVGMADSLEKQLNSILTSLKEPLISKCLEKPHAHEEQPSKESVSTQTEIVMENNVNSRVLFIQQSLPTSLTISQTSENINENKALCEDEQFRNLGYLCHECGQTFKCARNLGKHCKRKHFSDSFKLKIPCSREECDTRCWDSAAHKVHMRVHESKKPFYCHLCLKLFMTKSNLTAHLKYSDCQTRDLGPPLAKDSESESTSSFESSRYRCENCGLRFRNKSRYTQHVGKKCSGNSVFKCMDCGKLFAKKSELRNHQMIHTKTKSFVCDICGLAFSTKGNQRVHQRIHSAEKRFQCHHCQKGFTRKQTLQIHVNNFHKKS